MPPHHTKDKGDLGVAKAHADMVSQGFIVLFPATEHAPFDLVAYGDGEFHRMQVKYRAARAGAITVHFRSVWNDRQGTHTRPTDKSAIDVVCIYCPETDACYYIRPSAHRASVTLRVAPSRNGQRNGVIDALAFRNLADAVSRPSLSAPADRDVTPVAHGRQGAGRSRLSDAQLDLLKEPS